MWTVFKTNNSTERFRKTPQITKHKSTNNYNPSDHHHNHYDQYRTNEFDQNHNDDNQNVISIHNYSKKNQTQEHGRLKVLHFPLGQSDNTKRFYQHRSNSTNSNDYNKHNNITDSSTSSGHNIHELNMTSRTGKYKIIRTLGKGNFAQVKLAIHLTTGKEVAIKMIDKTRLTKSCLVKLAREVKLMKCVTHPNIVQLYEVIEKDRYVFLVMEYAENGEIFEYLLKHGRMTESEARIKFRQILSAVQYCHQKRIVHRDLKAENLLLDYENRIKLADFGFANRYDPNAVLNSFCGSPPYAAPELLCGQQYIGPEVDIWALGVILYLLVSGTLPFEAPDVKGLHAKITKCEYRVPYFMSTQCELLIKKMLVIDPKKRSTLEELMKDTWVNKEFEDEPLKPYIEPAIDYQDPIRIAIMNELGFRQNEIKETFEKNLFNNVRTTYIALDDREIRHKLTMNMAKLNEKYSVIDTNELFPTLENESMESKEISEQNRKDIQSGRNSIFSPELTRKKWTTISLRRTKPIEFNSKMQKQNSTEVALTQTPTNVICSPTTQKRVLNKSRQIGQPSLNLPGLIAENHTSIMKIKPFIMKDLPSSSSCSSNSTSSISMKETELKPIIPNSDLNNTTKIEDRMNKNEISSQMQTNGLRRIHHTSLLTDKIKQENDEHIIVYDKGKEITNCVVINSNKRGILIRPPNRALRNRNETKKRACSVQGRTEDQFTLNNSYSAITNQIKSENNPIHKSSDKISKQQVVDMLNSDQWMNSKHHTVSLSKKFSKDIIALLDQNSDQFKNNSNTTMRRISSKDRNRTRLIHSNHLSRSNTPCFEDQTQNNDNFTKINDQNSNNHLTEGIELQKSQYKLKMYNLPYSRNKNNTQPDEKENIQRDLNQNKINRVGSNVRSNNFREKTIVVKRIPSNMREPFSEPVERRYNNKSFIPSRFEWPTETDALSPKTSCENGEIYSDQNKNSTIEIKRYQKEDSYHDQNKIDKLLNSTDSKIFHSNHIIKLGSAKLSESNLQSDDSQISNISKPKNHHFEVRTIRVKPRSSKSESINKYFQGN